MNYPLENTVVINIELNYCSAAERNQNYWKYLKYFKNLFQIFKLLKDALIKQKATDSLKICKEK